MTHTTTQELCLKTLKDNQERRLAKLSEEEKEKFYKDWLSLIEKFCDVEES